MPIQEEQIDGASARLCSEENIMDIYIYTLLPLFKINRLLSWEWKKIVAKNKKDRDKDVLEQTNMYY
jgi:hypothetical protein